MIDERESRGTKVLLEIETLISEELQRHQVDPEKARTIGRCAAERVRQYYGGIQVYMPKGLALVLSERDREIWRKFNGGNYAELAREYNLTDRQIRSIVARVKEEEFQKRQGKLFE